MVIYAGYDCRFGYKTEAGAYPDDTPSADQYYYLPATSLSTTFDHPRINHTGFGQRTRRATAVGKVDDALSFEMILPTEATNTWAYELVKLAGQTAAGADTENDTQLSFLIEMNTDRDDTWNAVGAENAGSEHIYAIGCYINSVTITGAEGEATKVSVEVSVNRLIYSAALLDTAHYFDANALAAANALDPYYSTDLTIAGGGGGDDYSDTNSAYTSGWSVTINNNHTKRWGTGSKYPFADEMGACEITGSISKDLVGFESIADIYADDGGHSDDTLAITMGGVICTLYGIAYDSVSVDISENELIGQEISFSAAKAYFANATA